MNWIVGAIPIDKVIIVQSICILDWGNCLRNPLKLFDLSDMGLDSKFGSTDRYMFWNFFYYICSFVMIYDYYATILKLSIDVFNNVHFH